MMDVDVQLDAMWCKQIACLMHPQKHPWKVFMERQITGWAGAGEGVRAVLSRARPVNNALPARLQMYIRAFRASAPHCMQPAETTSFWAVMAESLLLNQQVPDPRHSGILLSGSSVVGRALRAWHGHCAHAPPATSCAGPRTPPPQRLRRRRAGLALSVAGACAAARSAACRA